VTEYLERSIDWRKPEVAENYDGLPLWSSYFGHVILEKIPLGHNKKVLDVGFGTGFPLIEIAERLGSSSEVYGVDQWESALARAKKKLETRGVTNVKLFYGSADSMPFDKDFFDFVTANLVLNNLEKQNESLTEIFRVLKTGGSFHMTSNLVGHMKEFYDIFGSTLTELSMQACTQELQKNIDHRLTTDIISNKLATSGFIIEEISERSFDMRFADGTAMLNHSFIILGFMDGWKNVIPDNDKKLFFKRLEENLNKYSKEKGELRLTIPMVYVRAGKK
jgi:ubiquinone/menaquinone biosynthesis C-methylase UbiE